MSGFLLDTMVISDVLKKQPNRGLNKWLASVNEDDVYLSVFSVGELQKGLGLLNTSDARRASIERWLVFEVIPRFNRRMLPFDANAARHWGNVVASARKRGLNVPVIDSLIAATASLHGLTIVTRNERDFAPVGVRTLNPWS